MPGGRGERGGGGGECGDVDCVGRGRRKGSSFHQRVAGTGGAWDPRSKKSHYSFHNEVTVINVFDKCTITSFFFGWGTHFFLHAQKSDKTLYVVINVL